jgi:branched-chain amino acid transport system substrate-binding protein
MIAAVAALAVSAAAGAGAASAQEVKVGLILPYTGICAELAQQMDRAAELYLKENADQIKPYKITIIRRDSKAPNGAEAKVAAQELFTQSKVDVLTGWSYSPDAIASAPVVNAGKKLGVIMNAATSFITELSPYYVRTSFTLWHSSYALGIAAMKNLHAKTAVVAYTDYPPGKDSLDAFKLAFEQNGGKVLDAIPAGGPGQVPDFTPFFQRAKDEHPDVLFVFVPAGDHATAVVKTYGALGMRAAGTKLSDPATSSRTSSCKAWATRRSD